VLAEQNAIPTAAQEYAAAVELIIKLMAVIFQFKTQKNAVLKPCQPLCIDLKIFMQGPTPSPNY